MKLARCLLICGMISTAFAPRLMADAADAPPPRKNIFDMTPDKSAKTPATAPSTPAAQPEQPSATPAKTAPVNPPKIPLTPAAPAAPNPAHPTAPSNPAAQAAAGNDTSSPPQIPATVPSAQPAPTLFKVPTETELVKAKKQVDEIYARDIAAAKTAAKQRDLAETLITTAVQEQVDHSALFQLLISARDLAVKGQDLRLACRAINQLGLQFYVDPLQYKASAVAGFRGVQLPASDRRFFCLQVEAMIAEMQTAGRFDLLPGLEEMAKQIAVASGDSALLKQIRRSSDERNTARVAYAALARDRETLKTDPTNEPSNTAVGQYDCFELGDWPHGLPMLVAGDLPQLKTAASAELAGNANDNVLRIANLWWDIAKDRPEAQKQKIQTHAADFYAKALPDLVGLERATVASRLAGIKSPAPSDCKAVDLLSLVNADRDTVSGSWNVAKSTGTLTSQALTDSRLTLMYRPPKEYDFRADFTREEGNNNFDLYCIGGESQRQFRYMLGGFGNSTAGFSLVMGQGADANPTGMHGSGLENHRRYLLVIRVRADGVQAFVDDKPIGKEYRTDFRDLAMLSSVQLKRTDALGVMARESQVIVHSAWVVEVTGHGHVIKADDAAASPVQATALFAGTSNKGRPFNINLHLDGEIDSSIGHTGQWFVRGNDLTFRWGDIIESFKLSNDRKTFEGKSNHGVPISGQILSGEI